eukprot:g694.t1
MKRSPLRSVDEIAELCRTDAAAAQEVDLLDINGNEIEVLDFCPLQQAIPKLRYIDARNNCVVAVRSLDHAPALRALDLRGNFLITLKGAGVTSAVRYLHTIRLDQQHGRFRWWENDCSELNVLGRVASLRKLSLDFPAEAEECFAGADPRRVAAGLIGQVLPQLDEVHLNGRAFDIARERELKIIAGKDAQRQRQLEEELRSCRKALARVEPGGVERASIAERLAAVDKAH